MSYYDMQFIHKPLVQVKIGGVSVSLYPIFDALMSAAKRAHGFHVNKNNLLSTNLALRQVLNALGKQTGQGTVVNREIAGFLCHFNNHWTDFWNITILRWHNSTSTILTTTATATNASILLPVQDGNLNTCRQQDVRFVQVQVSVDYSYSIRGVLHYASTSTSGYLRIAP